MRGQVPGSPGVGGRPSDAELGAISVILQQLTGRDHGDRAAGLMRESSYLDHGVNVVVGSGSGPLPIVIHDDKTSAAWAQPEECRLTVQDTGIRDAPPSQHR